MLGIIVKGIGGFYYVKAEDGLIYECKARGIFRKEKIKPMIGDRVSIEIEENGYASITEIKERASSLIRPPVANIDTLVICLASKNPEPDFLLCDKLILMAKKNNITPIILITKTDLDSGDSIKEIYKDTGFEIFDFSKENPQKSEIIKEFLKGKTTAFAGLSGVGKSSLLNIILDKDLETGDVSKINRGKHTTRHIELFELSNGGFVLDTPGFSSFDSIEIDCNELYTYYPEMNNIEEPCRFAGCVHINEPDCKVKELLEKGKISKTRYENYVILYNILKNIKKW